jgi:hypothetical protein
MFGVMLRVVTIAGLLGGLAACGAAMPPVPGKGGPAWIELTSEHFTLWTDAAPGRARELVRKMEHLRQVIVGVAFPGVPSDGRNLVIALRDDDELSALSAISEPRAFAAPAQAPLWQPMTVLSADNTFDAGEVTAAHELTHLISYAVIHHQPRWFAEGMAVFFETVGLDPASTTVDIGVAPTYQGRPLSIGHLVPIPTLFAWGGLSSGEGPLYRTAWGLFTFLINEHRTELVRYMQLLDRIDPRVKGMVADEEARAWNEAFPSLPVAEIYGELGHWLGNGRHLVWHAKIEPREWPVTETRARRRGRLCPPGPPARQGKGPGDARARGAGRGPRG